MKRAIVYYSLSNNTKEAAEYIAEKVGADVVRIETVKPMPDTMVKQILLGGMQSSLGMRPRIKDIPVNLNDYDEIVLGMPVWAGRAAAPVNTLLKKYGIADKITAVFTLSGSEDNDKCIASLKMKLKNLKVNVALVDRKSKSAKDNRGRLEQFVEEIR